MIRNKRAAEKYYLIISIVLGLMVLFIALYWIFQEYFGDEELNREVCRQSVVLRGSAPTALSVDVLKKEFPLKCRTDVINIDSGNRDEAETKISDAAAMCWNLVGEGKLNPFPEFWFYSKKACMVCARIHADSNVRKDFAGSNQIRIYEVLKNRKIGDQSELAYIYKPFANHYFGKRCNLDVNSESFKKGMEIPDFWSDTSKDLFIVASFYGLPSSKVGVISENWKGCSFSGAYSIPNGEGPWATVFITNLEGLKNTGNCGTLETIPA